MRLFEVSINNLAAANNIKYSYGSRLLQTIHNGLQSTTSWLCVEIWPIQYSEKMYCMGLFDNCDCRVSKLFTVSTIVHKNPGTSLSSFT